MIVKLCASTRRQWSGGWEAPGNGCLTYFSIQISHILPPPPPPDDTLIGIYTYVHNHYDYLAVAILVMETASYRAGTKLECS